MGFYTGSLYWKAVHRLATWVHRYVVLSVALIRPSQDWQEGKTTYGWWNYLEQSAKEVKKYQGIHNEGAGRKA